MKKAILIIGMLIVLISTLACTSKSQGNMVCCESFGYGAMMEKCCETYEWTNQDGCVVPEGFVGGGKQIVDDKYCQEE